MFDFCLMNPPFMKGLAYKFLESVIQLCECSYSIQPVTWLYQPIPSKITLKHYETIGNYIEDLDIIDIKVAKLMFNITGSNDVGIYKCTKRGGYDYMCLHKNEFVEKIVRYLDDGNLCNVESMKNDGYRVKITVMTCGRSRGRGHRGPFLAMIPIKDIVFKDGKYDGKYWYEYYWRNQNFKNTPEIPYSVKFDTEEEGHNFYNSLQTDFIRYYMNGIITSQAIGKYGVLWLGNAKNPRTGETGYKSKWTNEDLYKFFDIDEEQQKVIEEFIRNYDEEYNRWLEEHNKNKKRKKCLI